MTIKKVLIANRGEIALRVLRACKELGIQTVAVYSKADEHAMHVRLSDESICIGPAPAKASYLNIPALLTAAEVTGADAIHPGYGFLSENADFAQAVEEHGLIFIGPSSRHIRMMGDKITAKNTVKELGIPVVPGSAGKVSCIHDALKVAQDMGYPILIKASSGGGGKGMQVVYSDADLEHALNVAKMEAKANFGDESVFIEKYLQNPRHIEIQILSDRHGNVVHLAERDCSIQRRHQKVWEEAPSPVISEKQRKEIGMRCANAMKTLGYEGLGTIEFLYEEGQFYFIEMNTRVQVEHPVTEAITGKDLLQWQLKVAGGERLSFSQEDIAVQGHAIECRINAEDAETFIPSPGRIDYYHAPGGFGVRVDSAIYGGYTVPPYYDSLVAKLIVHGENRQDCLARLSRALNEYVISGIKTNLPLHKDLVKDNDVVAGHYSIHWLASFLEKKKKED